MVIQVRRGPRSFPSFGLRRLSRSASQHRHSTRAPWIVAVEQNLSCHHSYFSRCSTGLNHSSSSSDGPTDPRKIVPVPVVRLSVPTLIAGSPASIQVQGSARARPSLALAVSNCLSRPWVHLHGPPPWKIDGSDQSRAKRGICELPVVIFRCGSDLQPTLRRGLSEWARIQHILLIRSTCLAGSARLFPPLHSTSVTCH